MNRYLPIALLLATSFLSTASAQRVDNSRVRARAGNLREAALNFERVVVSVRGIERSDERIVDRFEEATKRVVLAAKNPRHSARLKSEYLKMLKLQEDAERAIFGQYTPHQGLIEAWDILAYHQYFFEQELSFQIENPRHGNRVRKISSIPQTASSR